jgi:hypothetical protein
VSVDCDFKNTLQFDLDKQEPGKEVDVKKHQDLRDQVFADLKAKVDRVMAGEALPEHDLYGDAVIAAAVADKVRSIEGRFGKDSLPGRISGAVKPVRKGDLIDFQEKLHEAVSEPELAKMLSTMDPVQQQQMLANWYRSAGTNSLRGMYMTLYMNSMLSNPYTLGKATGGHFNALPQAVADRYFAEMWSGKTRFTDGSKVVPGEAVQLALSYWDTIKDQVSMLGRRDWAGVHAQMVTEGEYHPPIPMATSPAGRMVNAIAGAPSAVLGAQRAPFKVITRLGELRAQAFRQATLDGVSPDKFWPQMEYYRRNPTADMMKAADQSSAEYTFTKNMDGVLGDANRTVRSDVGKVLITPFARVGFNIMDNTWQGTPGLNFASKTFHDNMWGPAATPTTRAIAMGKLTTGTVVIGTGATLGLSGLVTGDGPADPNARRLWEAAGWRPNTIYSPSGKPVMSHLALGVFSGWLAMGADSAFLFQHSDAYTSQGLAASAALILAEPATHAGYVEAFGNIVQGIKEGVTSEFFWREVRDRAQQLSLLTPGIVKFATQTMDPDEKPLHGVGRGDFYEKQWAALKGSVTGDWPGWADGQPAVRNFLTDAAIPRDGALTFLRGGITADPVAKEMDRLQQNYGKQPFQIFQPPKYVFGKVAPAPGMDVYAPNDHAGVALNLWEQDRLIQLMAGPQPGNEPTLHKALMDAIASPEYAKKEDGPNGGKAMILQKIYTSYKTAAERRLVDEDKHLAWEVEKAKRTQTSNEQDVDERKDIADLPPEPPETSYPRPGQKER